MAKFYFILLTAVLQSVLIPAQSINDQSEADKFGQIHNTGTENPKVDGELYSIYENTRDNDDKSVRGQRQKRFDNYFSFGFSPFLFPFFSKQGNFKETDAYDIESEDPLSQIFRRVQEIVSYTRQQPYSPPSNIPIPVPSFVPVYVAQGNCGCSPDTYKPPTQEPNDRKHVIEQIPSTDQIPNGNQIPSKKPENGQPVSPTTTSTTAPTIFTTNNAQTVSPPNNTLTSSQSPDNVSVPDFIDRMSVSNEDNDYDEEGDGSRPISFVPLMPNRPLNRPAPPVEHGSSQAGKNDAPASTITTTIPPPSLSGYPAQPDLPTNAVPTLCDGAVLTCCHQAAVSYDCFEKQGCPEPSGRDNPCDAQIILRVINKFQYYYSSRQG